MDDPVRWLSPDERRAWLGLLALVGGLPAALESQLQRTAGLNLFEYLVLAQLSEQPDRAARLTTLAALANGSLSRLSHVLTRLERRGYVRRSPLPGNGRVTVATLTDAGADAVEVAAPGHVETVRHLVFEPLTTRQVDQLAAITARIGTALRGAAGS